MKTETLLVIGRQRLSWIVYLSKSWWSVALVGSFLLVGVSFQLVANSEAERFRIIDHGVLLGLPKWTTHVLPLTGGEVERRMTQELVHYDDAIRVSCTNGNVYAEILIFAWTPRKISPEQILMHTPDVCWVENGMKLQTVRHLYPVDGQLPAEYREFTVSDGRTLYVLYWPLYGNQLSPALRETWKIEGWTARLRYHVHMWRALTFGPPRTQHYIRLTSTLPPDVFIRGGGSELIYAAFAAVGIRSR